MNKHIHGYLTVSIVSLLVLPSVLGGSKVGAAPVSATYELIKVNGKELPAVSWITKSDGKHCEFLTIDGALMLSLEERAGAFALERVTCIGEDGSKTSSLGDFVMFTGSYEISGDRISIRWSDPPDYGTLNGNLLTVVVIGVGDYEGQTTHYSFRRF